MKSNDGNMGMYGPGGRTVAYAYKLTKYIHQLIDDV